MSISKYTEAKVPCLGMAWVYGMPRTLQLGKVID